MNYTILMLVTLAALGAIAALVVGVVATRSRERNDRLSGQPSMGPTGEQPAIRVGIAAGLALLTLGGLVAFFFVSDRRANSGFPAADPGRSASSPRAGSDPATGAGGPGAGSDSTWALASELEVALNAGDLEALGRLVTSDAIVVTANQEMAGRADLERWTRAALAEQSLAASIRVDEITTAENDAFAEGRFTATVRPAEGAPSQVTGSWMARLRRARDGSWQVARLMWTSPQR